MGKKEEAPTNNKAKEGSDSEDEPVVKTLKELDVKFCAIEFEYEQEVAKLRKKYYDEKQKALVDERKRVLGETSSAPTEDHAFGTPACKGFWLKALQNCEDLAEVLEEWDEPVLEYLDDMRAADLDPEFPQKGFKLELEFKENPFFTNTTLCTEYYTDTTKDSYKPWKEPDVVQMKSTPIDWKAGKNVTIEVVQKKVRGGGAKKAKQKGKTKEEPRNSIFRLLNQNLKAGDGEFPPELLLMVGGDPDDDDGPDDEDKEQIKKGFMSQCYDLGEMFKERIIPYAVRYYTGEADEPGDDDDEESESEDEDDDDDDDDESEDEPQPKKGGKKKGGGGAAPGSKKEEECKQQ